MPPNLAAGELAREDNEDDDELQTRLSEKGWHGAFIRSRLPLSSVYAQRAGAEEVKGRGARPSALTTLPQSQMLRKAESRVVFTVSFFHSIIASCLCRSKAHH